MPYFSLGCKCSLIRQKNFRRAELRPEMPHRLLETAFRKGGIMVIIVPTMDISGDYADAFTIGKEVDFTFSGSACHVFGSDGKNLEF